VKKTGLLTALLALVAVVSGAGSVIAGVSICGPQGEALYKKHCSACHRDAVMLKRVANIVDIMRKPPSVMPNFDKDKISDRDAAEIADYIHQGSDSRLLSKKNTPTGTLSR
jgi:mono/diheme cytochrome c family protein